VKLLFVLRILVLRSVFDKRFSLVTRRIRPPNFDELRTASRRAEHAEHAARCVTGTWQQRQVVFTQLACGYFCSDGTALAVHLSSRAASLHWPSIALLVVAYHVNVTVRSSQTLEVQ
jgi:hypothetical protein